MSQKQKRLTKDQVEKFEKLHLGSREKICGVYGIVFTKKNVKSVKIYVGSSMDIVGRCQQHLRDMKNTSCKTSSKLLECYNNPKYQMNFVILERFSEDEILSKEREYQHKWAKDNLLNNWVAMNIDDIKPWLEKAVKCKAYKNHFSHSSKNFYNGTPCKESNAIQRSGYAKVQIHINGEKKHLVKHRIAYWEKYGEYPELVRHLCNNKCCYNPNHLKAGTHSENGLDKRGDFPRRFENDWVRLEGDVDKLTELYEWKRNCQRKHKNVSTAVYNWEKKLGLREKYPDIYNNKRAIRPGLWRRKDIQEFIQECEERYGKKNVKIAEALNKKFDLKLTPRQVSHMKRKIKGKSINKNRKRVKNCDKTGAISVIRDNYEEYSDEDLAILVNQKLGTSYKIGTIRAMRFYLSLYKPKIIQEKSGDLYRRDALSKWGIEAEKLVEYFGDRYSDEELLEICKREYGVEMEFDDEAIQELRQLVGSKKLLGQTG